MATITNANGGNWNAGGTWVGGVAPASGDTVVIDGSLGYPVVNVVSTCAALTVTGAAAKTGSWSLAANLTVSGTLTLNGNSATNRVIVQSNTVGTARTITSAAVSLSNVDFVDITGAGAATWTGTSLGDCGGNSGITFTAQRTLYRVAAGNFSDTNWSLTSGGAAGQNPPLPQDNVVLNASSGVGTITVDMPRACKDLTCTGYTGTLARTSVANTVYGSLTLASGMTYTTSTALTFGGRGSHVIDQAGKNVTTAVTFVAPGGTYTLASAKTCGALTVSNGTLNTAGFSLSAPSVTVAAGATLTLGSSTVTLTGTGTVASVSGTINAGTSTIVLSDTSAATKTIAGGGKVYNNLVIQGGAINSVVVTGANTFNTITAPAGTVLTLPASTTTTVAGLALTGAAYNGLRLPNTTAGCSVPHVAGAQIADTITWYVDYAADSWTAAGSTQNALIQKQSAFSAAGISYNVYRTTGGLLQIYVSDGTTARNIGCATAIHTGASLADRDRVRLKFEYIRNTGGGSCSFKVWWSKTFAGALTAVADWTQLGATATAVSIGATQDIATAVSVGGSNSAGDAGVYFGAAVALNAAPPFANIDFTQKPWGANSFVESSSNAATVTINGDLAKAGDGRVLLISSTPGTKATISAATGTINGDYLVVVDSTATGGAAFNAGVRSFVTSSTGWNATGTLTRTACALHSLTGRSAATKAMTMSALAVTPATGRAAATKACNIAAKAAAAHLGSATTAKAATLGAKGPHAIAGGVGKRYAWWKVIEGGS